METKPNAEKPCTLLADAERFHYGEYCRLRDEALALYRKWDLVAASDTTKMPHYRKAASIMREADEHKALYIGLGDY